MSGKIQFFKWPFHIQRFHTAIFFCHQDMGTEPIFANELTEEVTVCEHVCIFNHGSAFIFAVKLHCKVTVCERDKLLTEL